MSCTCMSGLARPERLFHRPKRLHSNELFLLGASCAGRRIKFWIKVNCHKARFCLHEDDVVRHGDRASKLEPTEEFLAKSAVCHPADPTTRHGLTLGCFFHLLKAPFVQQAPIDLLLEASAGLRSVSEAAAEAQAFKRLPIRFTSASP